MFHAISEHCTSIDDLHIGTQRSRALMVLFQPSSGVIDHIDRLAPRLTCLKRNCEPYVSDRNHDTDAAASRLATLMSNAKSLRVLYLSSSIGIDERSSRCILQGRQAWPHFSLLDLGHMRTTQETLAAIIGAQRDTLVGIGTPKHMDVGVRLMGEFGREYRPISGAPKGHVQRAVIRRFAHVRRASHKGSLYENR